MNYENIPAIPPPPGVVSNFENPETLASSIIGVNVTFLSLMLIVVFIRIYARSFIVRSLGWDDYMCVVATLGAITHSGLMLQIVHYGFGAHLWDIRAVTLLPSHLRQMDSLTLTYVIGIFFVKLSILLLYIRIFGLQRSFRILVYCGIIFCVLFHGAYLGSSIAEPVLCVSTRATSPICTSAAKAIIIYTSVLNVCTDIYILVLPIRQIMGLQMRKRQKIGLLGVFLSGIVACTVSIVRLVSVIVRLGNPDSLYYGALTALFSTVELNVAIITSSMTAMPQFFSKSKLFQSSTYSSLKHRLFSARNGILKTNLNHQSNNTKVNSHSSPQNDGVRENGYLELQETYPRAQAEADPSFYFGEDNESGKGILKSTNFDVSEELPSKREG